MKPILSICYPTYNRGAIIYNNVKSLIEQYENDDIEIVIVNNNSTDDTEEKIKSLNDNRIVYYKNDKNIGANNLIASLRKASAPYGLLVSDEDEVMIDSLKKVLDLIKTDMVGVVYAASEGSRIYSKPSGRYNGMKAMDLLYDHTYMSGLIYNVDIVKYETDGIVDEELYKKFSYGYGFLILALKMAGEHGLLCSQEVITRHRYEGEKDYSTYAYLKEEKDLLYKQRIDQIKAYINVFCEVYMTDLERAYLVNRLALRYLDVVTMGSADYMLNAVVCKDENGKDFYWPPVDKDFNPRATKKRFLKEYYDYAVLRVPKSAITLDFLIHPFRTANFIRLSHKYVAIANGIMKDVKMKCKNV